MSETHNVYDTIMVGWDTYQTPISAIKPTNLVGLIGRTMRHQLSNVADAELTNMIRDIYKNNGVTVPDDDKEKLIAKYRNENVDWAKTELAKIRDAQWERMLNGEFKLSTRGPRMDPVDREFEALLLGEAKARLARVRDPSTGEFFTWPDKDETVLQMADGVTRTRVQILDNVRKDEAKVQELRAKAEENVALKAGKAAAQVEAVSAEEAGI